MTTCVLNKQVLPWEIIDRCVYNKEFLVKYNRTFRLNQLYLTPKKLEKYTNSIHNNILKDILGTLFKYSAEEYPIEFWLTPENITELLDKKSIIIQRFFKNLKK